MSIKLELIDELRKRANVSYEEAKDALEKNNGDMLEAIIYLEKQKKVKPDTSSGGFFEKFGNLIKKGNETNFIIRKNENIILRLPLTVVVIITIVAPYVTFIGLLAALFTGHRFKFEGKAVENTSINENLDKISNVVDSTKDKIVDEIKK